MKKISLIIVLMSLAIGLRAQCDDDFKDATVEMRDLNFEPYTYDGPLPELVEEPIPPNPNEVRRIYFIHGLGSSAKVWTKAAEACELGTQGFPARKCETIRTDYTNSTTSLYLATSDVRTAVFNQATTDRIVGKLDPSRAILIGHSQGGVVIRQLMHLDMVQSGTNGIGHSSLHTGMNYGGVVTIAASLQGTAIINNRNDIGVMLNDACNRLLKGPNNSLVSMSLIARNWIVETLGNITEKTCNTTISGVKSLFFNQYYAGVTEDYKVGASTINTLNQDTNNAKYKRFPKVTFYAVEPQQNILWRTLNWVQKDPNGDNGSNGPNVDHFEANDDWRLYNTVKKDMIDKYKSAEEAYLAEYERLMKRQSLFFIGAFVSGKKIRDAYQSALAWNAGVEWFNNANTTWQTIIGAKAGNVVKENDGIITAETAANLPYAQKVIRIYPNEHSSVDVNKGSSHMQVRNDKGLKDALNELFNGDYNMWFWTAKD